MQQFIQASDDFGIKMDFTTKVAGTDCPVGAKVSANYTGSFKDGTVFDSNTIAKFGHVEPFIFTVGVHQVIKCWDYAIEHMAPGDTASVFCPSATAYGTRGVGPIPPNTDLFFKMSVVSC